jgi:hypothetical protein
MNETRAILTAAIYFGSFIALGLALRYWIRRRNVDLTDVHGQAGPDRRERSVFLLGAWRREK